MNDTQKLLACRAVFYRVKAGRRNILKGEITVSIPTLQPLHLAQAERTLPVMQQFEAPLVHSRNQYMIGSYALFTRRQSMI